MQCVYGIPLKKTVAILFVRISSHLPQRFQRADRRLTYIFTET